MFGEIGGIVSGLDGREEGGAIAGGMTNVTRRSRARGCVGTRRARHRGDDPVRTSLRFLPVFLPFLPPPLPSSPPRHRHPMSPPACHAPSVPSTQMRGRLARPGWRQNLPVLAEPPPRRSLPGRRRVTETRAGRYQIARRFRNHGGKFPSPTRPFLIPGRARPPPRPRQIAPVAS